MGKNYAPVCSLNRLIDKKKIQKNCITTFNKATCAYIWVGSAFDGIIIAQISFRINVGFIRQIGWKSERALKKWTSLPPQNKNWIT
jgi:hypothetical protein